MPSQAVQDLMWVVNSPSFVQGENVAPSATLAESHIDADALESFLGDEPPHRVGRYFEQLVHFWLADIRGVDMLGVGLQIRDGRRTIGELDFVYVDEVGECVHCEVSVKFFLHHPRVGHSDFPGPNSSDNFELKTTKLFDQQLELSREHFTQVETRHAFVKGMVFYRSESAARLPARMNQDHARGSWLYAEEIERLLDHACTGGHVVQKPHWLAPLADATVTDTAHLLTAVRSHFAGERPHPVMISLRDGALVEIERIFVVPSHWPT